MARQGGAVTSAESAGVRMTLAQDGDEMTESVQVEELPGAPGDTREQRDAQAVMIAAL